MPSSDLNESLINCKQLMKDISATAGLFLLNAAYLAIGAVVFSALEAPNELHKCYVAERNYAKVHNASVNLMLDIADRAANGQLQKDNGREIIKQDFIDILRPFSSNVIEIGYNVSKNCSRMGQPEGPQYKWTKSGALAFSMTVTTTIGYGVLYPVTSWGKGVCIAYLLIGVPMMVICLANVGEVLASIFKYSYATICCCGCCMPKSNKKNNGKMYPGYESDSDDEDDEEADGEADGEEEISVPLTVSVIMLLVFNLLGSTIFVVMEGWSIINSFYYCFTTFTTIGFGDFAPGVSNLDDPKASSALVFGGIYQITGMAWASMCLQLMQNELVAKAKWIAEKLRGKKKTKDMAIDKKDVQAIEDGKESHV